jgi:hypothetical protein
MGSEERHHFGPQFEGRRLTIARAIIGEEGVARAFENSKLEILARLLEAPA